MAGIENIPLRIPTEWDAAWFEQFVREVLVLADVRNAEGSGGVSVTGSSSEKATISASAGEIVTQPVIVVALSGDLSNERQLTGATGEIILTDGGANNTLEISIDAVAQAKVTGLTAALAAKVDDTRAVNTSSPLNGGGDLTSDLTLTLDKATAVSDLSQTISSPPTQAEVQAISDKIDELLGVLRAGGLLAT